MYKFHSAAPDGLKNMKMLNMQNFQGFIRSTGFKLVIFMGKERTDSYNIKSSCHLLDFFKE